MSSRRYQEDIRRIVGMPDVAGGLDDDLPRMRIDGARGVFVIGTGETQTGASPGTDADGNDKDPITPPEGDGNTNDDGSGTGDGNTDSGATNPDDFIDDEDESNWTVGDDLFGGNWGGNGGTTFADCVTGKCIVIVDGDKGYIPPEGWDSADDPPSGDSFTPTPTQDEEDFNNKFPSFSLPSGSGEFRKGVFWDSGTGVDKPANFKATASAAISRYLSDAVATDDSPTVTPMSGTACDGSNITVYICFKKTSESSTGRSGVVTPRKCACDTIYPGAEKFCNENDPNYPTPSPYWPADGCIQMAKNADGQWAASPNESPADMTAKYSEAKSSFDLCTPSGDGVQILPGADGGDVYWNYTKGIYRAVSPDGKQSFGGSSGITHAVAGNVAGGADGPKGVGSPVPSG